MWLSGLDEETKLYPDCVELKILRLKQNVEGRFVICKACVAVSGTDTLIKFVFFTY